MKFKHDLTVEDFGIFQYDPESRTIEFFAMDCDVYWYTHITCLMDYTTEILYEDFKEEVEEYLVLPTIKEFESIIVMLQRISEL